MLDLDVLDEDERRVLVDAQSLRQLTNAPGWRVLMGLLEEAVDDAARRVLAGSVESPVELLELRGYWQGLSRAKDLVADALSDAADVVERAKENAE